MVNAIREFLKLEAAGGILLMGAAALALIVKNSPLDVYYELLLGITGGVYVGDLSVEKPVLLWVNDLWMSIFFLLVGLELKRELLEGELSNPSKLILPTAAAIGGMVVPAAIYVYFNWGDSEALNGWAIPAATDIAFALGVLALLGSRIPAALKVFLVSLAIMDDIGAIVIIAAFYTDTLSGVMLLAALFCLVVLFLLNRRGVTNLAPYILVGVILWLAVLKSGVHATLAGVVLAFFIPMRAGNEAGQSPLHMLEHSLHAPVAFVILPAFAFCNAGISLEGLTPSAVLEPVPLGIAAGLFFGKQIGVFGFAALAVLIARAPMPAGVSWSQLYGVSLLAGIGFTMSLFISGLAFAQVGMDSNLADDRLGILVGTLLSAVAGYLVLRFTTRGSTATE